MKRRLNEPVLPLVTKRAKGEDVISEPIDKQKWERPPLLLKGGEDIIFQQLDIDYTMVCN